MPKVTDLQYNLEQKIIERMNAFVRMVTRKKQINDVLFCVHGKTGCLSGDSIISIHRNKVGRKYNIKYLYNILNRKINPRGRKWNLSKPIFVRSFNGNIIKLHKIKNVLYSGIKELYKLTLENGLTIKATSNHKFLTKENEWIELSKLDNKEIMCDTLKAEAIKRKRIKLRDIGLNVGKNHPFNLQPNNQISVHTLIYEAKLNDLGFLEYLDILLNESERCKTLQYINPKTHLIHHKDGNHYNNSINNLELLKIEEHHLRHDNYSNFSQGSPKFSKVLKIEKLIEKEDVYDIECEEPYYNFVANGIIVHNSGKTNTSIILAYYLKSILNRDIHLFFKTEKATDFAKATTGKIIIIDEPSLDSLSKDQMTRINKNFMRLLNTMRQKRHIVIVNITRFWRFPFDLVVDRSLAMINMFNKDGKSAGRFHYIRQRRLERLWDDFQKTKKKNFGKYKSFGGWMPERMEKLDDNGNPYFNSMGIIINDKINCTYEDYKDFRDKEVGSIGEIEKVSKKELEIQRKYKLLQYKVSVLARSGLVTQSKIAEALGVHKADITNWYQMGEKEGIPLGNQRFGRWLEPHIINSMVNDQKNLPKSSEEELEKVTTSD